MQWPSKTFFKGIDSFHSNVCTKLYLINFAAVRRLQYFTLVHKVELKAKIFSLKFFLQLSYATDSTCSVIQAYQTLELSWSAPTWYIYIFWSMKKLRFYKVRWSWNETLYRFCVIDWSCDRDLFAAENINSIQQVFRVSILKMVLLSSRINNDLVKLIAVLWAWYMFWRSSINLSDLSSGKL